MTKEFRILHCFRAPVGGLFRHVCDLAAAQAAMGHEVGVICDARTGGRAAAERLERLAEHCALGIARVPMSRQIGPSDLTAVRAVRHFVQNSGVRFLHGHGAKGGAYARLVGRTLKRKGENVLVFYTPHGGSLHYSQETLLGRIFLRLEQELAPLTDGLIFESAYSANLYRQKVVKPACEAWVIPNGLWPHEFYQVVLEEEAADFLFIGELRHLKGVDVLLEALAQIRGERGMSTLVVGAGPDERNYRKMAQRLDLTDTVAFPGPQSAGAAFSRGQCLVVPSRAESFPYIVLEAAAARLPMILTNVGGIPEIVAGTDMPLIPPGDPVALAGQMRAFLADPKPFLERARTLQKVVSERYTVAGMAHTIVGFYERVEFFARRK